MGLVPAAHAVADASQKPHIVIIMVDDMGYSDVGCYGAEIETPHLDDLAAKGLRFTQFYNTGRCCPTRASLLTGLYPHQAGIGHMTGDYGHPSYQGRLKDQAVTIAEALKPAGYFSAICGKWHVGSQPDHWPLKRGFDRFYGTPQGGGHHYRNLPGRDLVINDKTIPVPKDWYSTTAFTDHAIQFFEQGVQAGKPVFLYLAYTAPHWALHAPEAAIAKFRGRYAQGWQPVREARFARQKAMGLFAADARLTRQDGAVPAWAKVKDQDEMDLRMATHAAMVHLIDHGVGRLVAKLKELGQLDNTLLMFLSDNGASAEKGPTGFTGSRGGDPKARTGTPDSYNSFGIAGANLCNTPFQRYKMEMYEGGIATPLIVHWPDGIDTSSNGQWRRQVGHVIDLLPTCLDVAGAPLPGKREGKATLTPQGVSLTPAFRDQSLARDKPLCWEHEGNRAIREGDWKLTAHRGKKWELFNLASDRTETRNLASSEPERVKALAEAWRDWADEAGVLDWQQLQKLRRKR